MCNKIGVASLAVFVALVSGGGQVVSAQTLNGAQQIAVTRPLLGDTSTSMRAWMTRSDGHLVSARLVGALAP